MTDHDRTVLVTGGTGFLGGWCVAELLRRGYTVRTTVRDLRREPKVRSAVEAAGVEAGEQLSVLAAELTADEGWAAAVRGGRATPRSVTSSVRGAVWLTVLQAPRSGCGAAGFEFADPGFDGGFSEALVAAEADVGDPVGAGLGPHHWVLTPRRSAISWAVSRR